MSRPKEPRVAVRNAGDEKQVKRAGENDRARLERERNEDMAVWSTPAGRSFTRRLLVEAGVHMLSMAHDQHWTAFNEGGRNVGLKLLDRMKAIAFNEYLLMEQEHAANQALEPSAPEKTESTEESES